MNCEEDRSVELLKKKRRTRGGHRAATTRLLAQAESALTELQRAVPDEREHRAVLIIAMKEQLECRKKTLVRLDAEVLDIVCERDEDIETELVDADEYQLMISAMLKEIDVVHQRVMATLPTSTRSHPGQMPVAEARSTTGVGADAVDINPDSSPAVDVGLRVPETTPSVNVGADSISSDEDSTSMSSLNIRLPRLDLPKFDGNVCEWASFWESFEASIHKNCRLQDIEKFRYLKPLLNGPARDSIKGLSLSAANYAEAVQVLKRRFGNRQQIVNRHMDTLLAITPVSSCYDLARLRTLYDVVESNVRSLRSLGVASDSYGTLLSSVLMRALPGEMRLIVSRIVSDEDWTIDALVALLNTFQTELEARERALTNAGNRQPDKQSSMSRYPASQATQGTATSLIAGCSSMTQCVYCRKHHNPEACSAVTSAPARRKLLRRYGRCFLCLERGHLLGACQSSQPCSRCGGRHHCSICNTGSEEASDNKKVEVSSSMVCVSTQHCLSIMLQTAQTKAYKVDNCSDRSVGWPVRLLLDSGSQKSYITCKVREELKLASLHSEDIIVKTFGSAVEQTFTVDIVELYLEAKKGEGLVIRAYVTVVPKICDTLHDQNISGISCKL